MKTKPFSFAKPEGKRKQGNNIMQGLSTPENLTFRKQTARCLSTVFFAYSVLEWDRLAFICTRNFNTTWVI